MTNVLPSLELDPLAILAALGVDGVGVVEEVRGGWDTRIWRVEIDGKPRALRVFRPEQAVSCRREVAAMAAARSAGVPVPEVVAAGDWNGRPALLISWCEGLTVAAALAERPWRAARLGTEFGRIQAAIHSAVVPAELQISTGRWIAWAGPVDSPLGRRLADSGLRADVLMHLDYHPLNALAVGTRLTGVIDWTNALAGDPRADLARTTTLLRLGPAIVGGPLSRADALAYRVLELAWSRAYRRASSLVLEDMPLFYAWAGAAMLRDLSPKLDRPGIPLTRERLKPVERWTAYWMRRAGIDAPAPRATGRD